MIHQFDHFYISVIIILIQEQKSTEVIDFQIRYVVITLRPDKL